MEWGKFFETSFFACVAVERIGFFRALIQNRKDVHGVGSAAVCHSRRMIATPFQFLPALCNYMRNSQAVGISTLPPKAAVLKF